jgi:hypothetical protein
MEVPFLERKTEALLFSMPTYFYFMHSLQRLSKKKCGGGDQQYQHFQVDGFQITGVMVLHSLMLNLAVE